MEIKRSTEEGIAFLAPVGHIDSRTAPEFERAVLETIKENQRLIIDLAELQYLSSAGVRVMLIAAKRLNGPAAQLMLASMSADVREVFEVAGLMTVFKIADNRSDAVHAMQSAASLAQAANLASGLLGGSATGKRQDPAISAALAEHANALLHSSDQRDTRKQEAASSASLAAPPPPASMIHTQEVEVTPSWRRLIDKIRGR